MLYSLYQEILFRPIFNALIFLYNSVAFQDFGIAIILLTIGIRLLLYPLFQRSLSAQKQMADIQPEIKKIQETYKDNKEEQARRLMEIYRQKGVNPFSGCLPIIVQLPILIALYQVFLKAFDPNQLQFLYSFVTRPEVIHQAAFGFIMLTEKSALLAILAGLSQYLQAITMPQPSLTGSSSKNSGEPDMAKIISYQIKYFFPFLIAIISWSLPAALPLYWTVLNLFAIVQQKLMTSAYDSKSGVEKKS